MSSTTPEISQSTGSVEGISTLAEFMDWVQKMWHALEEENSQTQQKRIPFYRGHADVNYELEPTVYRKAKKCEGEKCEKENASDCKAEKCKTGKCENENTSYSTEEFYLYQEMLRRNSDAFAEDKTLFERLVRMQHHGLPTRLLDLTENPLVALYFACKGSYDKVGSVIFFYESKCQICYPSTIPPQALAGVEVPCDLLHIINQIMKSLSRKFFSSLKEVSGSDQELIEEYRQFLTKGRENLDRVINSIDFTEKLKTLQRLEIHRFANWSNATFTGEAVENDVKNVLIDFEARFKSFQKEMIEMWCEELRLTNNNQWSHFPDPLSRFLNKFTCYHFVYPPLNNERIRRQQGAFLLFPPAKRRLGDVNRFCESRSIRVKGEAKKNIREELAKLGISHSYLFPELEEQAKDIKRIYPPCNSEEVAPTPGDTTHDFVLEQGA